MRIAQKQEIFGLIDNLYQVQEEIKKALEQNNLILAQDMISGAQESAILLGEKIEKIEGEVNAAEPHRTVVCIEEYCELLFRVFEDINKNNVNVSKVQKLLRKQLIKIENSAKNDIAVRKEIVFFPYKASMWDSLESVYLAAKADPDCDAYCVPIPYYTLNPDHSLGEMHYEGNVRPDGTPIEYPEGIEITDWQEYDFEERKPDVVYIHNGYDNWNLVTSVHPRFYSGNLKKYTDKLVYIPYFVLDEIDPDNEQAVEAMKHFCFMPGIINADKVIVQSEDMKKIYINEYLKAAKEHGLQGKHLDREYLEQKFLGLGSPKYDRVCAIKKEDLDIPLEWQHVIERADGSCKKIILYNTGIAALLTFNEKWVDKIENVLKIFKENQDEIALLWRPHPLIESTMKSMRPEVLQKYMMLKERYLAEGWGIYDETADVDRAVVLSDAYYGDSSSVVQLYKQTGKPIMIQNVEILA